MGPGGALKADGEWRNGLGLIVAATIGILSYTGPLYMIGLLVKPLGEAFGWSRASVSTGFLFAAFGTFLLSPVVGPLLDRVGPRKVALWGIPAVAVTSAGIGFAGPSIYSWYICWALFAVAQAFCNAVIWVNAIVGRFDRHRGTALGLVLTGAGLFYGVGPVIGLAIMTEFGWRAIFFVVGAFNLLVAWPLAWLFLYGARDRDRAYAPAAAAPVPSADRRSVRECLAERRFWQIGIAFAISAAAVGALMIHLQPILTDGGLSAERAALVVLVIGPVAAASRLATGILLDYLPATVVAFFVLLCSGLPYVILTFGNPSLTVAYVCAVFVGLATGAETDMLGYLVSRYFAPGMFGRVYAVLLGIFGIGYGTAPIAAGAVFDASATYAPIFVAIAVATLIGAGLVATMGKPPRFGTSGEDAGV
jgi:predicted MFS family arabinose efflux permease